MSSSMITNNGAMQALQVLNQTNKSLSEVQGRIATGMKVADSKDNAAVWAVASTMRGDVSSFSTIKDNLSLAESGVSVARGASESIVSLLDEMKNKIVSAQDGAIDRNKLQDDINELKNQITGVANAAQFNGINYLKGSQQVSVLSSLDRDSTGVGNSYITFDKQNLVVGDAAPTKVKVDSAGSVAAAAVTSVTDLDFTFDPTVANNGKLDLKIGGVAAGQIDLGTAASSHLSDIAAEIQSGLQSDFGTGVTVGFTSDGKIRINDAQGRGVTNVSYADNAGSNIDALHSTSVVSAGSVAKAATDSKSTITIDTYKTGSGNTYAAGDFETITVTRADGTTVASDVSAAASMTAVATTLQASLGAGNTVAWDANRGEMTVTDTQGRGLSFKFEGDKAGKLSKLATLDVTTTSNAQTALADIETMSQSAINSASSFGSAQKRIGLQKDFMGKLADSLKSGVGSLVDADMTAESARLQALQVQQQLGTQALSIANQAPQSLLSLFR